MAVLAVIYGIISGRGMWYAINVLAAGFFPGRHPLSQIGSFQWDSLLIASVLHLLVSLKRRSSLRCDATHVSAAPDPPRRFDCTRFVVGLNP